MWWTAERCWFSDELDEGLKRQSCRDQGRRTSAIPVFKSLTCRGNIGRSSDLRPGHHDNHPHQFVTGKYGDVNVAGGYDTAPICFVKLYRT
jgi:hypothetical protein